MPNKGFDYSESVKLFKTLSTLESEYRGWLIDFMYDTAQELIVNIKQRTPVDTGALRDSWRIENIEVKGSEVLAWFRNDQEYASYVEWGHAWPYYGGIASEGDTEWVYGRFMMRVSVQEIYDKLPSKFNSEFDKFLQRRLKNG